MEGFLKRIQVFAVCFAVVVLVASGKSSSEVTEGRGSCWRNSRSWPHGKCFHSSICNHHCQISDNAISGQCFFFKYCKCKFCDDPRSLILSP
ncbi:Gamma-thionin [Vigna unguiculata]|uniref:Gamma-thionin n=1 Tax=Vigna unguiculata TaxID=3917 RepID=A0A4D6NTP4_VIGUN|nr:Gamma-thionin [Vigna unguiculata]